jgi:hypothetical protein
MATEKDQITMPTLARATTNAVTAEGVPFGRSGDPIPTLVGAIFDRHPEVHSIGWDQHFDEQSLTVNGKREQLNESERAAAIDLTRLMTELPRTHVEFVAEKRNIDPKKAGA